MPTILRLPSLILRGFVFVISFLIPRNPNLWVFMADDGERFADNSKYLFLHCEDKEDVRNVWITTSRETEAKLSEEGHEVYTADSARGRYAMLRAGVFFETHGPVAPEYTGGARVVHLTHGNYFKKMLDDIRDRPFVLNRLIEISFERRRKYVVTSEGAPMENMISMRSCPTSRIIVTGLPRNDVLLREIEGERIGVNREALNEVIEASENRPVLIYAPTHRGVTPLSEMNLGFKELNDCLVEHDARMYVSPHPYSDFDEKIDELEHISLLDAGDDLYPFLRYSDALITDYSGIFYDFLLLDRPTLFYAPDLEEYVESRGLYFEYEDHVPGPIARDSSEFVEVVGDFLRGVDEHADDRESVRSEFYRYVDAESSERVYDATKKGFNGYSVSAEDSDGGRLG